jgi:hypothetical protein
MPNSHASSRSDPDTKRGPERGPPASLKRLVQAMGDTGLDLVASGVAAHVNLVCDLGPQLTAFFTSAAILASSVAVNSVSAKEVGHMAPLSRFAASLKPNVAYLDLNFCALWK